MTHLKNLCYAFVLTTNIFASSEGQETYKSPPAELSTCLSCKNKLTNVYWNNKEIVHCARCQKVITEKLKTEVQAKYKRETKAFQSGPVILFLLFPKIEAWAKDYYSKFSEVLFSFFSCKEWYNLMFFNVNNTFDKLVEKIETNVLYNFDIDQNFKLDIAIKQITAACNNYIFAVHSLLGDEATLAKLLAQASVFVSRLIHAYF